MIPLPSSCEGCPYYKYKDDHDNGFVPDYIVPGSKVFFLAQNPGLDEAEGRRLLRRGYHGTDLYERVAPQPLIGATGKLFNERFLPIAGLERSKVSLGNAIRCRPGLALGLPKADALPLITSTMKLESSKADIVNALKHCKTAHFTPPLSTRVVVTMGRYAMFAMTGISKDESEYSKRQSALENWRGYGVDVSDYQSLHTVRSDSYHSLESDKVVFFTGHIAALFYDKKFYHATLQDFYKIKQLLSKQWPLPLPKWSAAPPIKWPPYSAFDTEFYDTDKLIRWSLCDSHGKLDSGLYCVEADSVGANRIPISDYSTVLIQNALADIAHLATIVQFDRVKIEDLMLAHSVLWPGEPHSLNYINSVYGTLNRYKHLSGSEAKLYSALDAWEPMQMWKSYFIPEFRKDRESWVVYQKYRLPLISIIDRAQRTGVRLDSPRLGDLQLILQDRLEGYKQRARELTGDDTFNIGGSKQMRKLMYE